MKEWTKLGHELEIWLHKDWPAQSPISQCHIWRSIRDTLTHTYTGPETLILASSWTPRLHFWVVRVYAFWVYGRGENFEDHEEKSGTLRLFMMMASGTKCHGNSLLPKITLIWVLGTSEICIHSYKNP